LDDYIKSIRKLLGSTEISIPGTRAVIINRENEILLEERVDFKLWGLPGGSADPGEDIVETIQREVFEETGLTIPNPVPFGFSSSPIFERITFPNGDKLHSFNLLFFANEYSGEIKISEESTRIEWFDFRNLPPMLKNMENTVKAFLKYAKTNDFQIL
jgi:8-oxo-dGTP pyrophosphatase MutT (NUDIX family)